MDREQEDSTTALVREGVTVNVGFYRRCFQNPPVQMSFVVLHAVLCLATLVCLGIASTFDSLCAVKQAKSIVNCTENVLVEKPQSIVMASYLMIITNAIIVIATLYLKPTCLQFCGIKEALRRLVKKGSFWSYNITYIFVVFDYILLTFKDLDIVNKALAITLVVFLASKLIVAYFLNYVFPVKFPAVNERSFIRLYLWLAYWITLVVFFLATAHAVLAITLDVAEKISPIGNVQTGSHNFTTVCQLVFLGIKATFEGRLFIFYWNKFFHGDKDLFSTFLVLKPIQEQPIPPVTVEGRSGIEVVTA
ncbi:uncharacterized protein LOC114524671 [Dendronephthya gigantea]|uniref:uncharacterized protein LOC114524671 n=1 Tax=Dendronephthya gigantea TaxID=151771 RepID=UPI0010694A67|nr:uncharacterized protein LOC114524671 [Dendronephthya gigantea]